MGELTERAQRPRSDRRRRSRTPSRRGRTSGAAAAAKDRFCEGGDRARRGAAAARATVVFEHRRGHPGRHHRRDAGHAAPGLRADGTITAGTASQISDGAGRGGGDVQGAGRRRGLEWLAEIGAHGIVAGPDNSLQSQPSKAIRRASGKAGCRSQTSTWSRSTRRSRPSASSPCATWASAEDIVNVNGGAIALGHPIGASGARLALHLALELRRRGGGTGAAALCGGGGQGDALIVKVPRSRDPTERRTKHHQRRTAAWSTARAKAIRSRSPG